jgi:hypothetical protein
MEQTPQRASDHLANERTNIIGTVNTPGRYAPQTPQHRAKKAASKI